MSAKSRLAANKFAEKESEHGILCDQDQKPLLEYLESKGYPVWVWIKNIDTIDQLTSVTYGPKTFNYLGDCEGRSIVKFIKKLLPSTKTIIDPSWDWEQIFTEGELKIEDLDGHLRKCGLESETSNADEAEDENNIANDELYEEEEEEEEDDEDEDDEDDEIPPDPYEQSTGVHVADSDDEGSNELKAPLFELPKKLKKRDCFITTCVETNINGNDEVWGYDPKTQRRIGPFRDKQSAPLKQAQALARQRNGSIAILLREAPDLSVIRLHNCVSKDNKIRREAADVIDLFQPSTYIEYCPEIDGLQAIVAGNAIETGEKIILDTNLKISIGHSRFVSVSGKRIASERNELENEQSALDEIYLRYFSSYDPAGEGTDLPANVLLTDVLQHMPVSREWWHLVAQTLSLNDQPYEMFRNYCLREEGASEPHIQELWERAIADRAQRERFLYFLFRKARKCGYIPDNLESSKGAIEQPFPIEALGPILQPAVEKVHEIVQAQLPICALSFLSAANFLAQAHVDTSIFGRRILTSVFFLLVAESGDRKSAVDTLVFKTIKNYEKYVLKEEYETLMEEYKAELAAWKAEHKRIDKIKDIPVEERAALFKELGKEPLKPLYWSLTCNGDMSWQGIFRSLRNGQPSQSITSDEGGGLFGSYAMKPDNLIQFLVNLSHLHESGEASRNYAGDIDGPETIFGKRLMISIMFQRIILKMILENEIFIKQGFLGRTIINLTEPTFGRIFKREDASTDASMQRYYKQCDKILGLELPLKKNSRNILEPRRLQLDENAQNVYDEFHNTLQQQIAPGEKYCRIRPMAQKAHDNAVRLAATLAFFEDPSCELITADYMSRGIKIIMWALSEWLRIDELGPSKIQATNKEKEQILELLQTGPKTNPQLDKAFNHRGNWRAEIKLMVKTGEVEKGTVPNGKTIIYSIPAKSRKAPAV